MEGESFLTKAIENQMLSLFHLPVTGRYEKLADWLKIDI